MLNPSVSEDEELEVVAWGTPVLAVPAERPVALPASFYQRRGKRLLDITLGTALFIGLLPLMVLAGLAVLLFSGWPILYRTQRLKRDGQPFGMLKLRTMANGAHERLGDLLREDPVLAAEYEARLKLENDPRRTRIGVLLRRCSIDELPQFWHVITGDMTLVGPRPYAVEERPLLAPHPDILEMPPAITGPWQTRGRNNLPPNARLSSDVAYVRDVSFRRDVGYLLATVRCLLRPNGS